MMVNHPNRSMRRDYLIQIEDQFHKSTTYIVRKGKFVSYESGGRTPLSLSNLVGESAVTLLWALENARDGFGALCEITKVLTVQWRGNPTMQPKVQVLDSRKPL